jgi:putative hydrolase of the HAD superfamily
MKNQHYFFDAVGTLIYPEPAVIDIYQQTGIKYGANLDKDIISERFKKAYRDNFSITFKNNGMTNEHIELNRWKNVVNSIFYDSTINNTELFNDLWEHFSNPRHWRKYEDTSKLLVELINSGFYVGIASNFDKRILNICKVHFPMINISQIFFSTNLGYAKPNPVFYRLIENSFSSNKNITYTMIGDNEENDIKAAEKAGWKAIHRDKIDSIKCKPFPSK